MKFIILFLLFFSICQNVLAQYIISGEVTNDTGEALLGVNVYIKDSYDGTSTNQDGKFSFTSNEQGAHILIASFIGYKIFETEINLESDQFEVEIVLSEEINKIDGVTISAGAFEASDKKKGAVLKTFDIVTTAGATADITGVMNTLPGTQTVGEEGRLFVRGGAGHEAKTFINGLLVAEPYSATPNNIPSRFRFSPFLFKGAFFSTGGYSAEYGQALSSVLELNTYDLPARSQTDISIMSVGTDISQTIRKKNTSLYAQAQYTNLAPSFALVPQKYNWELAPNSINSTIHLKQKFKKGGHIQAYAKYDFSNLVVDQPIPGNIYKLGRVDMKSKNFYSNIAFTNNLSESSSVKGGVSYSGNLNNIFVGDVQVSTSLKATHSKLVFDYDITERILLKYGAEWIFNDFEESIFDSEQHQVQRLRYDNNLLGTFAEASIFFSNNLVARIGGRYEYNEVTASNNLSPRASISYKVAKASQFSLAFGGFSQLPTPDYLKWIPNLKPEIATHYILNYQYAQEGKVFRAEVYYKEYDQLVSILNNSTDEMDFSNLGYGYAKGIELFWRDSKLFEYVDYWISYSYLDTKRKYDIFSNPVMPYYASAHNFSIVYKHFIPRIKSQIGATYSFASGRPYTDPNGGEFNSKMTKSYNDLSLNYSYLLKPNMIIHVSASNILGFNNIFGYQYNSEPNEEGIYESIPIQPQAKRFLFIGFFITISKDKNANQLNNL